ncbi:MAG: universal stress protein [Rhodocyclaceae bacterium]|nr:universal stress protein [Rhodocyclaceae bacterium]
MNATRQPTIPMPSSTERDSDGRLVGLAIDCCQSLSAQNGNSWLLAVDGSEHSQRAAAEAVGLTCQMKDCTLHLVNVQHWLSKEAAESELKNRGWTATEQARSLLDTAGKPWRLHVAMGDAAERIVALATRLGCRGIVIGSRGLGAAENLLVGSVAYKVIHLSPVSVLVVR